MIDQTTQTTLQLPMQAAPIDRSQALQSATTADGGVEAAGIFEDIMKGVGTIGPMLLPLLTSDRTLKRDIQPVEWSR